MFLGTPVGATNGEIKFVGVMLILLGIAGQTTEFIGWGGVVINEIQNEVNSLGVVAYVFLAWQIILYAYGIRFIFTSKLTLKYVLLPFLYVDFIVSFALSFFYFYQVAVNGSTSAVFITLVLIGVFFGSDMLQCGGLVYLINNYVEPVSEEKPAIETGKYMVVQDGKPTIVEAQLYTPPVQMV